MNGIELVLIALILYLVAYKLYGGFIAKKLEISNDKETPSHTMYDGVDYCPAKSPVLLGHHFASIAGAGPIVGPVIAAGFGWIPVYVWVVFGAIFLGAYTIIQASLHLSVIKVNQSDILLNHISE